MNSPYATPPALNRAISDRARKLSNEFGITPSALIDRFFLHRLTVRVFHDDPEGWLLKGGQALLVRHRDARHSRDLDLLYCDTERGLDEALHALRRAAEADLGDHLHFEFRKVTETREARPTRKVLFDPYLGRKRHNPVSVDLVAGLAPVGTPVLQALAAPIDIELGEQVEVRLYPLADHIADKICAMYERHQGQVSSRVKDLVDLVVIALRNEVDGHTSQQALRSEVTRRRGNGTDVTLPQAFALPSSTWAASYAKEAKAVAGLEQYRTIENAHPLADRFVTPLLRSPPPGSWQPSTLNWH